MAAGAEDLARQNHRPISVLEILGSGGMGVVYPAEDLRLGRQVAFKLLHGPACEADPSALARFQKRALPRH